jgi:hypothetical protein
MIKPYIFGARVAGPSHVRHNLPCQDAYCYAWTRTRAGVIAVSDGLGSANLSDVGSLVAVTAAVECAVRHMSDPVARGAVDLPAVARSGIEAARRALEHRAGLEQRPIRDYGCTLLVVTFQEGCAAATHVGDGGVVAMAGEKLVLISGPGESEYANEVAPITSSRWAEFVRASKVVSNVVCVAAFTDGCQRAAFKRVNGGVEPFAGFFNPIFRFGRNVGDVRSAEAEIAALLASSKLNEHNDDDKTLVIGVTGQDETADEQPER